MVVSRALTKREQHWLEAVLRKTDHPRLTDRESLWVLFLGAAGFFGLFRVFESILASLTPVSPEWVRALSATIAFALLVLPVVASFRLRGKLAEWMNDHRRLLARDLREGRAEVYSHDSVESRFDEEMDAEDADLIVKFPEGEVRVDGAFCKHERIERPVTGWCEVHRLRHSGQVLEVRSGPPR